jgi:outer membrane PBP1 activator LpoA protein
VNSSEDTTTARRLLDHLLTRDLPPEQRQEALYTKGILHRTAEQYDESEASLKEVIATAGAESKVGTRAAYQLIWTYSGKGESDRALAQAADLANRRDGGYLRLSAIWATAVVANRAGDASRTADAVAALGREAESSPDAKRLVADLQRRGIVPR